MAFVSVGVAVKTKERDGVREAEGTPELDGVRVREAAPVVEGVRVGVGVGLGVALGDPVMDCENPKEGVVEARPVTEGVAEAGGEPEGLGEAEPDREAGALALGVSEAEGEAEATSAFGKVGPSGPVALTSATELEKYASAMSMGRKSVPKKPRYQETKTSAVAYQGLPFAA